MTKLAHITAAEPARAVPLDILLATIPSLPRPVLARLTARMIDRLDEIDGDPDLEDATNAEDEGLDPEAASWAAYGAGCEISDPSAGSVDDEGEAEMWTEGNWTFGAPIGGRQ